MAVIFTDMLQDLGGVGRATLGPNFSWDFRGNWSNYRLDPSAPFPLPYGSSFLAATVSVTKSVIHWASKAKRKYEMFTLLVKVGVLRLILPQTIWPLRHSFVHFFVMNSLQSRSLTLLFILLKHVNGFHVLDLICLILITYEIWFIGFFAKTMISSLA